MSLFSMNESKLINAAKFIEQIVKRYKIVEIWILGILVKFEWDYINFKCD